MCPEPSGMSISRKIIRRELKDIRFPLRLCGNGLSGKKKNAKLKKTRLKNTKLFNSVKNLKRQCF